MVSIDVIRENLEVDPLLIIRTLADFASRPLRLKPCRNRKPAQQNQHHSGHTIH
jgi:hypothetical protein